VGHPNVENQIAGHARSDINGAPPDPGSTPGASTNYFTYGFYNRRRLHSALG